MNFYRALLQNHVLNNLTFLLVLVIGFACYGLLPRQQDPEMNFNWIDIMTFYPGASPEDVEKLVTDPLEEALEQIPDIRFVRSVSRAGYSDILVRFNDLDERTFDKRMNDLRREIQNKEKELPEEVVEPNVLEITSANGFPTATIAVVGQADDENLRREGRHVEKDLERLKGVDRVDTLGLHDPEIHIAFHPDRLVSQGISPELLADTVSARFRDISAGTLQQGGQGWLVRWEGTSADPARLAQWPVTGAQGEIPLGRVAELSRAREKASTLVRVKDQPAVMLTVFKQGEANTLELIERLRQYVEQRNTLAGTTGVTVTLVDDQTHNVRHALNVMEGNALLGFFLVLGVTWVFLGSRIALLVTIAIPFILAGVFALLYAIGETLNVMVLLGSVIALGMLVDDGVVIVDAIHFRIRRGADSLTAALDGVREVFAPVNASVLTTMAAFLPLMLLPGILGKFMRVIPMVVTMALAISLIEAYWLLPAHITAWRLHEKKPSRIQPYRERFLLWLRSAYGKVLVEILRRWWLAVTVIVAPFLVAGTILASGLVRFEFFAMDLFPLFYVTVEMPVDAGLQRTLAVTGEVAKRVESALRPGEARSLVAYSGMMFTETAPYAGDRYGQVMVSLHPDRPDPRPVEAVMEALRPVVTAVPGPERVTFVKFSGGPPVTKPISIKVRGETFDQIQPAAEHLKEILRGIPAATDITDNFSTGQPELVLTLDDDAARRAGVHPATVARLTRLFSDGEEVATFQHAGEEVTVRVLAEPGGVGGVKGLMDTHVARPGGGSIPLAELVDSRTRLGLNAVNHYNFRRAITVEAELDKGVMDTVAANDLVKVAWERDRNRFPAVDLDFSGELDDIQESMDGIVVLFIFGVGLMYLILGTQFLSYWQPLLILTTVPMAFTGVVVGLFLSGHPISLYTLYGVVALSGIAVNNAIVLISAANERREQGMSVVHAVIYAAHRRLVPILITSTTTIAGLISLAFGMGGKSLMWGPVATAIVYGLAFSTLLTLFLIPVLYVVFMGREGKKIVT